MKFKFSLAIITCILIGQNSKKLFDNGETILHTAVIKAEEASVESMFFHFINHIIRAKKNIDISVLIDLGAEIFATNASGEEILRSLNKLKIANPRKYTCVSNIIEKKLAELQYSP